MKSGKILDLSLSSLIIEEINDR